MTNDAPFSEITVNTSHSIVIGDTTQMVAGNGFHDVRVNIPDTAPASAHSNVEATKKKPAPGDVFRFQPNNCAEWSVSSF